MKLEGGEMKEITIAGVTLVVDHKATIVAVDVGSGWHTLVGAAETTDEAVRAARNEDDVITYLGDRAPLGIRGEITLTDFLIALTPF
jgi:hypothetical protein